MNRPTPRHSELISPRDGHSRRWRLSRALGWAAGVPAVGTLCFLSQWVGEEAPRIQAATPTLAVIQPAEAEPLAPVSPHDPVLAELMEKLHAATPYVRAAAAAELGERGAASLPAVEALRQSLRDADPVVRVHAAKALWDIEHQPAAVEELSQMVRWPDPVPARLAAYFIGGIGPEAAAALPSLEHLMAAPESMTRVYGADAILRIQPDHRQAIDALVEAMHDGNRELRVLAAISLGGVSVEHQQRVLQELTAARNDRDPQVRSAAESSLLTLGTQLANTTRTYDEEELAPAPETVEHPTVAETESDDPFAAPRELAAATESAALVAEQAEPVPADQPIEELDAPEPTPSPEPALESSEDTVEIVAVPTETPEMIELPADIDPNLAALVLNLRDEDAEVRRDAADRLGWMGTAAVQAVPALKVASGDADAVVRAHAARAIWEITLTGEQSVPVLVDLLSSPRPGMLPLAAYFLGEIGPAAREALPSLRTALRISEGTERVSVAEAIIRIAPEEGAAVTALLDGLRNPRAEIRVLSAAALAGAEAAHDPRIVPALTAALDDADETVCSAAAVTLSVIQPAATTREPIVASELPVEPVVVTEASAVEQLITAPVAAEPVVATETDVMAEPIADDPAATATYSAPPAVAPQTVALNQNVLSPGSPDRAAVPQPAQEDADQDDADDFQRPIQRDLPLQAVRLRVHAERFRDGRQLEMPEDEMTTALSVPGGPVGNGLSRPWMISSCQWAAPAFCHNPIYYEERYIERYGYNFGLAQPVVSGVTFLANTAILPYQIGAEPPCECIYSLGKFRPGDCVPFYVERPRISLRGALFQAAAIAGVSVLVN